MSDIYRLLLNSFLKIKNKQNERPDGQSFIEILGYKRRALSSNMIAYLCCYPRIKILEIVQLNNRDFTSIRTSISFTNILIWWWVCTN